MSDINPFFFIQILARIGQTADDATIFAQRINEMRFEAAKHGQLRSHTVPNSKLILGQHIIGT